MSSDSSPSIEDRCCTQDWLENILDGYYSTKDPESQRDLEVVDWDIKPVEGEGYLSEMLALDVSYKVNGEETRSQLVAKLLPPDPCNRAFVRQTQFDLREIKFYTEVVPTLESVMRLHMDKEEFQPLPVPSLFHAAYKVDSESILVMEDLRTKGFSHQNLNKGLTFRQAQASVMCLAQIHAASIALQVHSEVDLIAKFPYLMMKEKSEEAFHTLFEKGLPLLMKYLQNKPQHQAVRTCLQDYSGNRSKDIFQRILTPSEKVNTLVHCDFWSNNIMFKTTDNNETLCQVVDWQTIMKGKPSIDLGMLITTSLTPEIRREHEEAIVNTYWSSLTQYLRQLNVNDKQLNYTFEDLQKDTVDGKLFGVLVMVGSVDIALGDPVREDRVLSLIKDFMKSGIL